MSPAAMYSFAVRTVRLELVARDVRLKSTPARCRRRHALRQRALQLALDELDLGARELVQRLEVLVAGDPRVRDDQDPVAHVVERQHRVEQHEARFVFDLGRGLQCHRFEPGRGVVTQVADGPAGEARQARHERRMEARHQLARGRDERLVRFGGLAGAIDGRLAAARPQDQERILAEERVAPHLLAAFNRLEQERVVGMLRDLEEGGHRRQQVGDDLLVDRHERAALRELPEFVERRYVHRSHPMMPSASANVWMSAASAAGSGTQTASMPAAANAALRMAESRDFSAPSPARP